MPSSLQVLLVVVVALASAATTSLRPEGDNGRHLGAERAPLPFPRDKAAYPATPLECFQVASPMNPNSSATGEGRFRRPHPRGAQNSSCTMVLMDHVFAHSYNHPFVAEYKPPTASDCGYGFAEFYRVILNLTIVSEGKQFDRLGHMWLGDIEIWRTSTAEPKPHPGIRWTFWKDSSPYLALWEKPQKLIFDLGNLINDEYTGSFNATLTATYSTHMRVDPTMAEPAHQILPISAGRAQDNQGSQWNYPRENAEAALEFPKDVAQAVVTIAATGQGDEEFWWTNVPDSGIDTFGKPPLLGRGSFREVRLSIDGRIAGLSWPFPTVFTGGISPPLHRPIVGLQAFDLREHEIDITPWLGVLCDGKKHTFGLKVVGADEAPANDYWVLSAKAFLWKHWQGLAATGNAPNVSLSEPNYDARQNATRNKFLRYDQTVSRELSVSGVVGWGQSSAPHIWHQRFEMRNQGFLTDSGLSQNVTADYRGYDAAWIIDPIAHFAWPPSYSVNYSYPISLSTKQGAPNAQYSLTLDAELTQQMHLEFHGDAVLPDGLNSLYWLQGLLKSSVGVFVNTVKSGKAFYWQKLGGKLSGGFGHSSQDFASGLLISEREEAEKSLLPLYTRVVSAVNDTITGDREWQYGTEYKSNAADGKAVPQDNQLNTFAPKFIGGTRRQKLRPDSVSVLTTEHGKNTKNRQARGRQSPMGPMFKENRL